MTKSLRVVGVAFGLIIAVAGSWGPVARAAEDADFLNRRRAAILARVGEFAPLAPKPMSVDVVQDNVFRLNANPIVVDDRRFDAVTFTALDAPANFAWTFHARNIRSWYIYRKDGTMEGFKRFWRVPPPGAPADAPMGPNDEVFMVQSLGRSSFVPGEQYVLWFEFWTPEVVNMRVRAMFTSKPCDRKGEISAVLWSQ